MATIVLLACPLSGVGLLAQGYPGPTGADTSWTAIAVPDSNPGRCDAGCCWDPVHDQVYLYGGATNQLILSQMERYDPSTNTWSSLAEMSHARDAIKGLYCSGHIYAIAGYSNLGVDTTVEEYSIASNTWRFRASIPEIVWGYEAVVWRDSLIYVFGGTPGSHIAYTKVYVFNPTTNTWLNGTDMTTGLFQSDACIIGDTIYIPRGGWASWRE
jgi:N-acetylneuraminic acid mutarotase